MVIINSFKEYEASLGIEIGQSGWHEIGQDQINRFAGVTSSQNGNSYGQYQSEKDHNIALSNRTTLFYHFAHSFLMEADCRH